MRGNWAEETGRVLSEGLRSWRATARLCLVATVVVVDSSLMEWLLGL
ncbi:hypothetical protein [Streptomyces sp. NPDC060035]